MPENGKNASYRYTAVEQREIDSLRQKYAREPSEDQLEELREIDHRVTRRATIQSVLFGVGGVLVFGAGLAMVLSLNIMIPGIIIGCVGIGVMASMPALYGTLLERERKKAAPRIEGLPDHMEE